MDRWVHFEIGIQTQFNFHPWLSVVLLVYCLELNMLILNTGELKFFSFLNYATILVKSLFKILVLLKKDTIIPDIIFFDDYISLTLNMCWEWLWESDCTVVYLEIFFVRVTSLELFWSLISSPLFVKLIEQTPCWLKSLWNKFLESHFTVKVLLIPRWDILVNVIFVNTLHSAILHLFHYS